MSETTLRASHPVLAGTTTTTWPLINHVEGSGDDVQTQRHNWSEFNLQYVAVMLVTDGHFTLTIRLTDGVGLDGADITPAEMLAAATDDVTDGTGYVTLANPSDTVPPSIPGESGNKIIVNATADAAYPDAAWEIGIFMKRLPNAGDGGGTADCPPRPDWPYPPASISALQGPSGVTRGARR